MSGNLSGSSGKLFWIFLVIAILALKRQAYHAFTIGLLAWLGGEYQALSNRGSGYGRYDLMVIPEGRARCCSAHKHRAALNTLRSSPLTPLTSPFTPPTTPKSDAVP